MTTMPVERGFVVTSGFGARWGTTHWGTDYGRNGGSGGYPVFAVKDGTVKASGPASGFGRWVCVDHPASNGGGYTVYGHVIPEVTVGQVVREGQRIARIDPSSASNGGVAPHLHFEWHRFVWSQPGPDRLDPQVMLQGASWPGDPSPKPTPAPADKLCFVLDISQWQNPISLRAAKADGIVGIILRTNDGTYRDQAFHSHLADARANDLPVSAYWFVRRPDEGTSIAAQANVVAEQLRGKGDIGVWLDIESPGGTDKSTVYAARDELRKRNIRVLGIYTTVGYWEGIRGGEPPASDFGAMWVANFGPDRAGNFRAIYPGNNHSVWNYPLGGRKPDFWQYTQHGRIPSFNGSLDVNAFRGSPEEVRALFEGKTVPTSGTEKDWSEMASKEEIRALIYECLEVYVGPIGSDVKDSRQQLTGGRDKGDYRGHPQLDNRTLVDAVAKIGTHLGLEGFEDPHGGSLKEKQEKEQNR